MSAWRPRNHAAPGRDVYGGSAVRVEGAWAQFQLDWEPARVVADEVEWGAEKFVQCLPVQQRAVLAAAREVDRWS